MRIHRALSRSLVLVAFTACHQARLESRLNAASLADGACAVLAEAAGTGSVSVVNAPAASELRPGLGVATFDTAWSLVARSHWDTTFNGVNWTAVRDSLRPRAQAARSNGELRSVLRQMLGTLGQSHFSILPQAAANPQATGASRDLSAGVGLTIRDAVPEMVVTSVRVGGAAQRAGIRPGFAVVAVGGCRLPARTSFGTAGRDERQIKIERWREASARLRGAPGDSLSISLRDGAGKVATYRIALEADPGEMTRVGNLPALAVLLEKSQQLVGGRTIGILRFNYWMPKLLPAIGAAIDSLRTSDAMVLDLRGNLGGLGMMSAGVAGHFVDSALTLGTMIQRSGTQKYIINPQRVNGANKRVVPFSGPVAVVVDELSVSTTEMFVAGLQALGRVRVFGAQTAGQALPAIADSLPNGDILYHAIATFLSPTGQPVEGAGVTPDVATPFTRAALLRGRDPALEAALHWAASGDAAKPLRR